jgi:hypothetical protein
MSRTKLSQILDKDLFKSLTENMDIVGSIVDPKNMDPIDPEVNIQGYGSMLRSQLRSNILKRLQGAVGTAKTAQASENSSNQLYKNLYSLFEPKGVLRTMIKAELDVADELESIRTKGGRRAVPIPKQK